MAYKATTIEDLLAIMKRVQGEKTLTQFAAELDLSKQYLSNVYNRRKEPSERLLDKLGFERQTTYFRSPTAACKEKKK
jgi:transcriptional regulator with XRE-family HTH domain